MEPVSLAIIAGVAAGATKIAEQSVIDLYQRLKALLQEKFGNESDLADAIDKYERDPMSAGRKLTLEEEVAKAKAGEDAAIRQEAEALLRVLNIEPSSHSGTTQMTATGTGIAMTAHGGSSTVNFNAKET